MLMTATDNAKMLPVSNDLRMLKAKIGVARSMFIAWCCVRAVQSEAALPLQNIGFRIVLLFK